jgi:chemotaxis protein MotB
MITLLLALFVVLFAMSSISLRKFDEFKTGLLQSFSTAQLDKVTQGGRGVLEHSSLISHPGVIPSPPKVSILQQGSTEPAQTPSQTQSNQIAQQIEQALSQSGLSQDAQVVVEKRGVVVRVLSDKAFFNTDSAALGQIGDRVVDVIAGVVKPIPNDIVVEGYTDSQPIVGGPYSSNFELSAVRAVTVLERLMRVDGISADRLSAVGYGDTHPLVPNTTPQNMALNRRVDVVILNTTNGARQ